MALYDDELEVDFSLLMNPKPLCPSCVEFNKQVTPNPASDKHKCPYAEDVHGKITWCTCCNDCYQQCVDDI